MKILSSWLERKQNLSLFKNNMIVSIKIPKESTRDYYIHTQWDNIKMSVLPKLI